MIQTMQMNAQDVQSAALDRARKALAKGDAPEAVLEQLAHSLTQKYLHGTFNALHQTEENERQQLMGWLPRLFPTRDRRRH
jgi:glutamyl-tRNA reductase